MDNQHSTRWAPRFFALWIGQSLSLIGTGLAQFALIWYLTQQTGSATVLATAALAGLLPHVVLGPVIGTLVDRWNRRRVIVLADAANTVVTLILALMFAAGRVAIEHVYAALLLRSLTTAFRETAMGASVVMLVPQKHLARIQGLNQTRQGLMSIAAAPLGALLLSVMPIQSILTIDWVSTLFAIVPALLVAIPQPPRHIQAQQTSVGRELREGLTFVAGWRALLIILCMAMLLNFLLSPAFALLPLLITKHFNGEAIQLGAAEAVFGIGVVAGGLLLGVWGGFKRRIVTSLFGLAGMGVGVLVIGVAPATVFPLALAGMLAVGFMNPICNGSMGAVMQAVIPPAMQGRVMSLVFAVSAAMSPLGLLLAGPISDLTGVQMWFAISGVACLTMALIGAAIPAVMNIERDRPALAPIATDSVEMPQAAQA